MSTAESFTRAQLGLAAPLVTVETHISNGLPKFTLVGLPEKAVKESKERVRSAIINSHFSFPNQRITINLAPADLPKQGARFDLAIAIGILVASRQLQVPALAQYEFIAELSLAGELRAVGSLLASAQQTMQAHRQLILAPEHIGEVSLCQTLTAFPAQNLLAVCEHLLQQKRLPPVKHTTLVNTQQMQTGKLSDVLGQAHAKRSLMIAAAGGHNLLMVGPPGSGKSMLAERFTQLLPPLDQKQALTVASLYDLNQTPRPLTDWLTPPFKAPHHTSSAIALVGGGQIAKPGQISLAHGGVLFLDELPEFNRVALEALREPLEVGCIHLARAQYDVTFPAQFQLIAAMNPCPCGNLNHPQLACRCTPDQINRYHHKLSQPLLDRIDLHLVVPWLSPDELPPPDCVSDATHRQTIQRTRQKQFDRQGVLNAHLQNQADLQLDAASDTLLKQTAKRFALSMRTVHRLTQVARTIADLEQNPDIMLAHLREALSYRCRLRERVPF